MVEIGNRTEVVIGDNTFFIQHYDPFTAVRVFGDLQKVASPILAELSGAVGKNALEGEEGVQIMDTDLTDLNSVLPILKGVFSSLHKYVDGDTLVKTLKMLLNADYVSVSLNGGKAVRLNEDAINLAFSGSIGGMLELAYHVVRVNYSDFFTIIKNRFGNLGA